MPKKKGGKKKGDGGGGKEKGLPPSDFTQNRQQALEALLSYRINGKQQIIEVYSEEAEEYKDKNYQQKHKNYVINRERRRNLDLLVKEALEFEKKLSESETVGREDVEKSMLKKVEWARIAADEIIKLEQAIDEEEAKLEIAWKELNKLRKYKNEIQHEKNQYIEQMKDTMKSWKDTEEQLKVQLDEDIRTAKRRVDQKLTVLMEVQKEKISERLLYAMDDDAKGEITDNVWLKQELSRLEEHTHKLQKEVDEAEQRNLEVMHGIYATHKQELTAVKKLISIPAQHTVSICTGSGTLTPIRSSSKIPDRQLDIGMLSIEGSHLPLKAIPDSFHLPPIEEQHTHYLPQYKWPVTGKMLKTISVTS
jgi:hypothetical protein